MRLPLLKEILLNTRVAVIGSRRPESAIVSGWVRGTSPNAEPHPSLYHIAIIQYTPELDAQSLTHWFRREGSWERVSATVIGPTHSFVV